MPRPPVDRPRRKAGSAGIQSDWRGLPWLLLLALVLRVLVALNTETVDHPDEVLQYLEPAHRLVFHQGVIPWEYEYGVRSWIIPGFIALILKALALIGLGRPQVYDPAIKVVLCAVSLALPLAVYRTGQVTVGERAARIALVLAAVWYELLYFAHKPLADALGGYALIGAMPLGLALATTRNRAAAFGGLLGLAIALRFQLAPPAAVLLGVAVWRWRGASLWALAGLALAIAVSGAFDAYAWGRPFSSIWTNVELNLAAHVADSFGSMPADYYLMLLALSSLGLAFLGAGGLLLRWRTAWPLIAVALTMLIVFSAVGHKEPRFVFPLIPLYLIGLAALADRMGPAAPLVPALAAAVSLLGLAGRLPLESRVYIAPILGRDDVRDTYRFLSTQADVKGVIDQSADDRRLYGYYDLHQAAPLYGVYYLGTQAPTALKAPTLYASHWIRRTEAPPPPGFHALTRFRRFTVWRRDHDPPQTPTPPGYSTKMGFPRLHAVPQVRPRW